MKAQRRHELKQNSLARALQQLPDASKQFGSRVALGVILVALIALWVHHRAQTTAERLTAARQTLGEALSALHRLNYAQEMRPGDAPMIAQERHGLFTQANGMIDDALLGPSDIDPQVKARAFLCKGDLNFTMANLPQLTGAATQPSLRPDQSPDDLLSAAADAYSQVLQQYPNDQDSVTAAHFGLAAVAEDRAVLGDKVDASQWDIAKTHYQAVLDSGATHAFKNLAQSRLQTLSQIQLSTAVTPTTLPTTSPTASPATTR